jgi:hypothetical protein
MKILGKSARDISKKAQELRMIDQAEKGHEIRKG